MNAQDLKNSILQLAVQGKLVEQRKEEGAAKELLKQIKAEKEKLIKEGKIKKEKPLPEITEDEITFDIPESWEWVRVNQLALFIKAGGDKPKDFSEDRTETHTIPVIANGIQNNGIIGYTKVATVDEPCITVSGRGTIGFSCIRTDPFCPIVRLLVLNISKEVSQKYIQIVLTALLERGVGTSIQQLTVPMLEPKLIPLPPLEEQKRIVSKIEELMPYVEKYGEAHSKLEEFNKKFPEDMQKSILQYAIQGKLVEQREEEGTAEELYQQIQEGKAKLIKDGKIKKEKPPAEITDDEIPFEIPESWKWVRLESIFQINPRNNINDNIKVSFIPMTLLEPGYQSKFSYETKDWGDIKKGFTHFKDRDIVIAKITPCFQNLKSAIMQGLENGYGAGTTELHVLRPIGEISLDYFLWFVKSPLFITNCVSNMTGTAGQQRVGTDIVKNFIVPLPPFEEQKRIVAKIEELFQYCKHMEK